jgi:LacI family transcriptional regulator
MRGYRDALDKHNLSEDSLVKGDFTQKSGYQAGKKLLEGEELPDAVFACNDYMAIGAMLAFQESGLHVPDDIAVAGFDNITSARYANPPLTTVQVPVYELGRRAGERLLQRVQSSCPPEPSTFRVPHELKVRASTKPRDP